MAYDISRAFEIQEDGLLLNGEAHVISGPQDPSFLSPPTLTIYFQTSGDIWYHKGAGFTWKRAGVINFAFHTVDDTVTISSGQEMIVSDTITITESGSLVIEANGKLEIRSA